MMKSLKWSVLGLILVLIAAASSDVTAQYETTIALNPDVIPVAFMGETIPLKDWQADPNKEHPIVKSEKLGYHPKGDWILNEKVNENALPQGEDPVWQKENPPLSVQQPLGVNQDGMGYTFVNPADPSLDAGPNHVIQMINGGSGAYFTIYDKLGNVLQAQTYFDDYFGLPGGLGDPIVLYDEVADRWLVSEFSASGNNMHVAISTTPDPTGSWFTYIFNAPSFPDYPKYSIWRDMYIITTNEAQTASYALDRTQMLAGAAATAQRFTMPDFGTIGFQAATPVSLNGTTLPPAGTPGYVMRMRDDAWTGATNDALEIWEFDVDFLNSANTTLSLTYELPISPFDSELCGYTSFSCIPQPGSGIQLDPLREVIMNRIHYRNFGSHESIVCCHVTDVDGSDRAGVRWYELRRVGGTASPWNIYQEGTYSPDSDSRFMCSIAIDATGSIAIAYNVSSSSTFPGLRYTGRKAGDPLGTMTEPETVIVAGAASNGSNRYGDYNQLNCDPDGQTFWFTGMYNQTSQWSTRICSFTITQPGVGCLDAAACNYDPDAFIDSGFCSFPGDPCNDNNPLSVNDVLQADCTCAGVVIEGCTNPFADNYDPAATVDDGSCIFSCNFATLSLDTDCWGGETTWELRDDTGVLVASGGGYGNLQNYTEEVCVPNGCYDFTIFDSFGDGLAGTEYTACGIDGNYVWTDDSGSVLIQMLVANFGSSETQQFCFTAAIEGCTNPAACNYNPAATVDDGSCQLPDGCTDPLACNYDAAALCDDGSCQLPDGCTNATACNYNASALCDDGSCILPDGCTDASACNYDASALCDDGSCILPDGCTNPTACNYDPTAACDDGSCQLPDGCTDISACNYNASALCDDGSCILPDGCTEPTACNYDPAATCDDGSCEFATCLCPGDFNGDGFVNVGDLLFLLSDFGCLGICVADLNDDGKTDSGDILELLAVFGTDCP